MLALWAQRAIRRLHDPEKIARKIRQRFLAAFRKSVLINHLVDRLWAERSRPDNPLVIDVFIGTPDERRIYFRDAPAPARDVPYKLNDLFLESTLVRDTITDPALCRILAGLLDCDPMVCNSLTFERGSEQGFHFDTFYMPAPVQNKMVATWIALEGVHRDAGPLQYCPGSHKTPPYRFQMGRSTQSPGKCLISSSI
jgi:hypothetical protein